MLENQKKIVAHTNNIAYAEFDGFEMRDMKLLLSLISTVTDDKPYCYDAREMKKLVGMESQAYSKFSDLVSKVQKLVLKMALEDQKYKTYNIFAVLSFDPKNKIIEIEYNSKFIPFILNFNKNFSKYYLENIEGLNNKYGILLYLRARANLYKYHFRLTVEEIHEKYGKYSASDIDKRILNPALAEINKYTDINMSVEKEYSPLENGRGRTKIVSYLFKISKKRKALKEDIYRVMDGALKNIYILKSKVLNKETVDLLSKEYSEEDLIFGLKYAYSKINKDFETLTYLMKVINSGLKERDAKNFDSNVETFEAELVEDLNDKLLVENKKPDIEDFTEEEEKALLNYIVETDGVNYDFLNTMKTKSKQLYINTLRSAEKKFKNM